MKFFFIVYCGPVKISFGSPPKNHMLGLNKFVVFEDHYFRRNQNHSKSDLNLKLGVYTIERSHAHGMLSGFRIWHDRKNQRLQNNAEYCWVLSWAELKHRSTLITKRCLPSMSIMIRLPLVFRYRTYVIVIFVNSNELFSHPINLNYTRRQFAHRYHTEFNVHHLKFWKIYLFRQFSDWIQIDDVFVLL